MRRIGSRRGGGLQAAEEVRAALPRRGGLAAKLATLVECGYGGRGVQLSDKARRQLASLSADGWDHLPVCVAKTPLSISHDPRPQGACRRTSRCPSRRLCAGAGFVYALAAPS